jgi:hypothetical protein
MVAGEQRADIEVVSEAVEQRGLGTFSIPNWNKSYLVKAAVSQSLTAGRGVSVTEMLRA